MLKPTPEEQNFPDHNFQQIEKETLLIETRLRRKMVIKPKTSGALASLTRPNPIHSGARHVEAPIDHN